MTEPQDQRPENQLEFLHVLEEEDVWIDGDVFEVDSDTFAIHGVIPYGGEVEIATFDTLDEAKHVLDEVRDSALDES